MSNLQTHYHLKHDPFEINDDSDHIVEYQGELDPDKNYVNQFSYHLS